MNYRQDTIELRRGQQILAVRSQVIGGQVRFIGSLDGRECVEACSREAAVGSLIRRAIFQSVRRRVPS